MTIVAGIDEVGYGPTLGPLVVAAAVFRIDDRDAPKPVHLLDRKLKALLRTDREHDGLCIGDSKLLYTPGATIERIECSTLGHAILARGLVPLEVRVLLERLVGKDLAEFERVPWYGRALLDMRLPRATNVDDVLARADAQRLFLGKRGITFLNAYVAPVEVARFNHLSERANSKAWTLFAATCQLIERIIERYPRDDLVIHVDRHGARRQYAALLESFFPFSEVTPLHERRDESAYALKLPGRSPIRIDFKIKADMTRAPVALASVIAKTVRELFMESLNTWFAARCPGIRPTAGYPTDAQRFLADIGDAGGQLPPELAARLLIRSR